MKYPCRTVSLSKLVVTPKGVLEPLCQNCKNMACSNPIEERKVSVFGINKDWKVFVIGNTPYLVYDCPEGFTP